MKSERILPPKFLAAMIAVLPLPGSPLYDGDDQRVIDQALADLDIYKKAGVDSIIFENDGDLPYIQPPLDKKAIALMTKLCKKARKRFNGPIGVQMLEAANIESLEIAAEAGLDYIRVEAFVFCSCRWEWRHQRFGWKNFTKKNRVECRTYKSIC